MRATCFLGVCQCCARERRSDSPSIFREGGQEIARRLSRLFLRNKQGLRPAHGDHSRWTDEHWRDHVLFYEYFHGDTGAGIGASHQTGWTGLIAFLIQGFTEVDAEEVMEKGMIAVTEASAEPPRRRTRPKPSRWQRKFRKRWPRRSSPR
jgi:hypothetical protein